MSDDYYPAGAAHDPNAPYNEIVVPEKDFEKVIIQTFSKDVTITTNDYYVEADIDEDFGPFEDINTEDTDWNQAFKSRHFGIDELLVECAKMAQEWYDYYKDQANTLKNRNLLNHYKTIIEECQNWVLDDYQIIDS